MWRNWQTHETQNLAVATSCGFKSHHPHDVKIKGAVLTAPLILASFGCPKPTELFVRSTKVHGLAKPRHCSTGLVSLLCKLTRSVRREKDSLNLFLLPSHPTIRMVYRIETHGNFCDSRSWYGLAKPKHCVQSKTLFTGNQPIRNFRSSRFDLEMNHKSDFCRNFHGNMIYLQYWVTESWFSEECYVSQL